MQKQWIGRGAIIVLLGLAAGCGTGETPEPVEETVPPAAVTTADAGAESLMGVPAGGLHEWVADIQSGVRTLPATVDEDLSGAQQRAVELYATRQEFIEMFYGPGGRLTSGEVLGPAVLEAEARFHELMQMLGQTPPPDSARVAAAVAALDAQLGRVLDEAETAGVPLVPPGRGEQGGTR